MIAAKWLTNLLTIYGFQKIVNSISHFSLGGKMISAKDARVLATEGSLVLFHSFASWVLKLHEWNASLLQSKALQRLSGKFRA